jgi:RNA polymerase sigma-70 factor (ECF subfamily)
MYVDSLAKFCRAKLPTDADADDAVATTFVRFWSYVASTHVDNAGGVLFKIARTVIADFYRRRKETVGLEPAVVETLKDERAEPALSAGAEVSLVRRAMERLDDDYRTVILLRDFQGLSFREIARRMERSEGSVHMLHQRAMKELRSLLSPT